ncbi:MAG TPA: transposase [Dongiaceae bacterium]|nr:transposase [Dongiaceae bacterium]
MKSHYTAKELAGLPGLEITERAIRDLADREAWSSQKRAGRGGGKEYAIASLPAETQIHLTRQVLKNAPAIHKPAPVPAPSATIQPATTTSELKQWQRDIMDARVAIMRLIERAAPMVGVNKAINTIVKASINGELEECAAANARKGQDRHLSYDGIMKWWRKWKTSGGDPLALAPKDTENYLEPAWAQSFMACWSKPQKPCLTEVLEAYEKVIPAGIQLPTYGQARSYLKKMGMIDREKGRKTGNELKSIKVFRRRDTTDMFPGDAYTADGHCFDGEVAHPYHGRPFRPEITPVLDVATRRLIGWSIDLAESGLAVLDALRSACETFGVPAIFYTDNGSGYKNQMMTAPGTGIMHRLSITPEYSRPRNPQAHGLSERGHQTVLIKAAKQLCTYIGSNMDNDAARIVYKETRKAIKQGNACPLLIEWDDFVAFINLAVEKYNNTPHRGLPAVRDAITKKRSHMTPNQAWQLGMERMQRELPQDEWLVPANELPDLYHPALERTCNRGEIQFGTLANGLPKRYYSRDLEQWHGQRVQVAYCPSDARKVWVRDLEHQRLLAVAELAGNSDHYFAPSKLEEARIKRGQGRLKRLENQAEEIRLEMHGPAPVIVEHSPEIKTECLRIVKQIEEAEVVQASVFELPASERDRQYLWQKLDAQLQAGDKVPTEAAQFHRGWQNSDYFKAWRSIQEDLAGRTAAQ